MQNEQETSHSSFGAGNTAESSDTQRILNLARLEYLKAEARERFLQRQEAASQGWKGG